MSNENIQNIHFEELADTTLGTNNITTETDVLRSVKACVEVRVGQFQMTVSDLLSIKENQVIPLEQALEQEIDLLVNGKVVARGNLVAVGDNFAVKITTPPKSH